MLEHPFLPGTSKGSEGALWSPTIAVLMAAARISKAPFFFFYIHGRNEEAGRAQKRTRWLPTPSPPSIPVMILQYVSISQS